MNPKILNREFQHPADGWYQIEPKGDHENRAAKVVQVIDEDAINSIVNRFNAAAAASQLSHGDSMLIDHEHFKHDASKETIAYGWLQKLENRADGIYGQIRWTDTGKKAVDGGDYRFFSTEYDPADLVILNSAAPRRVRPVRLDGLTLTNDPNNRGGRPITNRDASTLPGSREPGASQNHNKERTNTMKNIATKLGLAPEASEDAILGEVIKLQNRLTTLEPLSAENEKLKNRITAFDGEQVDSLLALHGVKEEKLVNRLKPVLAAMPTRADRVAALLDFGFKPAEATKPAPASGRVLNRADGKPAAAEPAGNEQELAAKAEAEINSYRLTNRCTYGAARNAVRAQKPELFGLK